MKEIIEQFNNPLFTIDFCASILILATFTFFLFSHLRRKFVYVSIIVADLVYIASRLFSLESVSILALGFLVVTGVVYVIINASEYRYYILNNLKSKKREPDAWTTAEMEKTQKMANNAKARKDDAAGEMIGSRPGIIGKGQRALNVGAYRLGKMGSDMKDKATDFIHNKIGFEE